MLGTLAKYANFLPNGFISQLLEVRVTLLPTVAALSVRHRPQKILDVLDHKPQLTDSVETYAAYDWELQLCMARESGNPIYALILNDFASIFQKMATRYFMGQKPREVSLNYYRDLAQAIARKDHSVEKIVKQAMEQSIEIWHELKGSENI
jgi:GntR family negative regulator for fad regulon and positive regulator of fabA